MFKNINKKRSLFLKALKKDKDLKQYKKGINAMLTYLDKNEGFDYILQVQNHISNLENYGYETENIVEALRKQTNNSVNKDLYGCWVADNSIKLNAKTMEELRKQFNSKFKVAI